MKFILMIITALLFKAAYAQNWGPKEPIWKQLVQCQDLDTGDIAVTFADEKIYPLQKIVDDQIQGGFWFYQSFSFAENNLYRAEREHDVARIYEFSRAGKTILIEASTKYKKEESFNKSFRIQCRLQN